MSVHADWRAIAKTEAMYDRCQSAQRLASYGVAKTEQSAYGEMSVHADWRAIAKTEAMYDRCQSAQRLASYGVAKTEQSAYGEMLSLIHIYRRLAQISVNPGLKVAVMGCAVNGPGEAREADYGIAGGEGKGLIFARGQVLKTVREEDLIDELINVITEEQ